MPTPVSLTFILMNCLLSRLKILQKTSTDPPSGVYFRAFDTRVEVI